MATTKTFIVAGVSTLNGKTKLRFANDVMRIKILAKNGHEDIEMINLPHEMTKGEIAQHMMEIGFEADRPEVQDAIAYTLRKNPVAATVTDAVEEAATVVA
jgi:hypothetical protein